MLETVPGTVPGTVRGSGPVAVSAPGSGPAPAPASAPGPERNPAAAYLGIARRVQAIVHQQAQDLREMEDRHGRRPAVFDDLLRLDHGNALIGRLADSIAVLGGARPGRQWSRAVPLYSVLRGGMSRILDYQRVELHPVSEVAVVGPAVEPLIHALAELLDNATRYSPPHTSVHLTAVEVQTGIAIEIEDGGLSLSEEGRARRERMLLEAQAGIDLNDLGETPRLGLAVVGRLGPQHRVRSGLGPRPERWHARHPVAARRPGHRPGPGGADAGSGSPARAAPGRLVGPRRRGPRAGPAAAPRRSAAHPDAAPGVAAPVPGTTACDTPAPGAGAGQWLGAFMGGKDGGRS